MSLTCKVGGARETFEPGLGREVAGVLDNAFGAENEWEGTGPRAFGDLIGSSWPTSRLGPWKNWGTNELPNLLAMNAEGGGVYLARSCSTRFLAAFRRQGPAMRQPARFAPGTGRPGGAVGFAPGR